jgi:hypothetical protein
MRPPKDQMGHNRRIPDINDLLQLPISLQSGLTRPEGALALSPPTCLVYFGSV